MLSEQQINKIAEKYGMDPATVRQLVGELSGGGMTAAPAAAPPVEPGAGLGSPPVPPGQAAPGGASFASIFGTTPEEWRDKYDPQGGRKTLGGMAAKWMGLTDPNARASESPDTLLGAFLKPSGPDAEKTALAEKAVKHANPFAPETVEAQLEKRNKAKKTLGPTLWSAFTGQFGQRT